ncbi:MAG: glutaredoxin family protein [Pseudomonadota bacterium]
MAKDLILYSTDHCTLCDEALDLLLSMPELAGRSVRVVDLATADDELLNRYGPKVPVLSLGERELLAPFDREAVLAWLQH